MFAKHTKVIPYICSLFDAIGRLIQGTKCILSVVYYLSQILSCFLISDISLCYFQFYTPNALLSPWPGDLAGVLFSADASGKSPLDGLGALAGIPTIEMLPFCGALSADVTSCQVQLLGVCPPPIS